jgi:hypothetical protein
MMAFDEAHRYQNWVRTDWRQVNVEKVRVNLRSQSIASTNPSRFTR